MKKQHAFLLLLLMPAALFASGISELPAMVEYVDLERFSGPWYVYSLIPTALEKNAVNGIETYTMGPNGTVAIEYVYYEKSPQGKRKVMHQKGWIINRETGSHWKIQPVWPLRLNYLIIDLAEDYRYSVIGTTGSDYVWVLSRTPDMAEEDYAGITERLKDRGYPLEKLKRMLQEWD